MDGLMKRLSIFIASLSMLGLVGSYPNSVPNSPDICSKMIPGHGPRPLRSVAPYEILVNKQEMHAGHKLQIILQGKGGSKFKGFYMQVRDQDGSPVGSFLIPDDKDIGAHNCFNQKHNAVHHKNGNKKHNIMVYWKAPEHFDGKVYVVATVLQDFDKYWVNVKSPELISVSNTTSSNFIEKRTTTESPKAARILNYNPYSPFSPLTKWDESTEQNSSAEFLLSQASEDSPIQERQLFGIHNNFDFHGTVVSPPRKSKSVHVSPFNDHPTLPFNQVSDKLSYPESKEIPHSSYFDTPKGSVLFKSKPGDVKEKHSYGFYNPPKSNFDYLYLNSLHHHNLYPSAVPETNHIAPLLPPSSYEKPVYPPHISQSIQNEKENYFINHHYLQSPYKPGFAKPVTDPSYPNSGYFPKDILTKLTSYIPNIYNALTNNPLFNFNVDNTIESVWKPMKGVNGIHGNPQDLPAAASNTKVQMPKYGYLIYNPVRNNPYFVIPAANEEEFVAHHMSRRTD